ncbi:MAG TPA: response regulator [Polyangiaceae bacterium]|nr:response regulator [Polyangiaceae bacterium]
MQGTTHLEALSLFPVPSVARILFVDDDELVLRSIRRLLRGREGGFQVEYFTDPHAALRAMDQKAVDVIVSDVQMATLGGGRLLAAVQERHPDVARIVLSGETDPRAVFRTVPFAHQFLAKPFDAANLQWTLQRACALRSLLVNEAVRGVVGRSNDLPAAPSTYLALTQALRDPEASIAQVAGIVERDVGIAAKVLQISSSSFFGLPRGVSTIATAVGFLGLEKLRTLVLACEIVRMFQPPAALSAFSMDAFQEHGVKTARLARALLGPHPAADDAFVAGLLHRVGQLVLASRVPHRFAEALDRHVRDGVPLITAEDAVLGVTHPRVGAYLLGLWGIRQQVVEAVAYHGRPDRLEHTFGIPSAVHLATILADDPEAAEGSEPSEDLSAVPVRYLDRLGVLAELPRFREIARTIVSNGGSQD